jgi:hypothetical protein
MKNQFGFLSLNLLAEFFFKETIVPLVAFGFALGFFVFVAIPWLWRIAKPYIISMLT